MTPVPRARENRSEDSGADTAVISARGATLSYGERVLWHNLDLDIQPGEFLAVLGPNGSGKTSFVRALLGQRQLSAGTLTVLGRPPRRGSRHIGYIPQQAALSTHALLRARDLVRFGIDGHRFRPRLGPGTVRHRVDKALQAVGATAYADFPIDLLSGGERQRVRIAQALAADPQILLCDEPLLSLDLHHQRAVIELVDARRRSHGTAVVFVTHEINPVLGLADRVLYLARGDYRVGTPQEVLTSKVLSQLYGTHVDVIRVQGRIMVVGTPDEAATPPHHADVTDGIRS